LLRPCRSIMTMQRPTLAERCKLFFFYVFGENLYLILYFPFLCYTVSVALGLFSVITYFPCLPYFTRAYRHTDTTTTKTDTDTDTFTPGFSLCAFLEFCFCAAMHNSHFLKFVCGGCCCCCCCLLRWWL